MELKERMLSDFNRDLSVDAFRKWFDRHPDIEKELRQEVVSEDVEQVEVSDAIFQNGTFEELPSVKKWLIEQTPRVSPGLLRNQLCCLKNVCRGVFHLGKGRTNPQHVEGWTLKHPDRLNMEQAKEFIAYVHKANKGKTCGYRAALRAFFYSRDGMTVKPTDISGEVGKIGKWSRVVVEKGKLASILNYVKERDYECYVADHASYKTATRLQATLEEFKKSNLYIEDGVAIMRVEDKGFHRKGRQTWDKIIPPDLLSELEGLFAKNGDQAFANVSVEKLRTLNKEAYEIYLKDDPKGLELAMAEPFHFWRHQFAQHMLRATKWNYGVVSHLGGWSDKNILEKCYGAPPTEMLRKEGITTIPTI